MPPVLVPDKLATDDDRARFVVALRRSELRYRRALRDSIAHNDRVRKGVARATAKSKPAKGLSVFSGAWAGN